jgi:hypothetical protein
MDTLSATVTGLVVRKVGGEVIQLVAQRSKLWLMKKGLLRDFGPVYRMGADLGDEIQRTSTVSILDQLPPGVTYRDIREIVDGAAFRACALQLIAVNITEPSTHQRERAINGLMREFRRVLVGVDPKALSSYFNAFTDVLDRVCIEIAERVVRTPSDQRQRIAWADGILLNATLDAVAHSLEARAMGEEAPTNEAAAEWLEGYQNDFQRMHSVLRLPDLTSRKVVDASLLFVEPTFTFSELSEEHALSYRSMLDLADRTVILGDPGAGKSTASEQLALEWSKSRGPVFYIRMRELRFSRSGFDLVGEVEHICVNRYQRRPPPGTINHLLDSGQALIVLDALDEVATTAERRLAVQVVEAASRRFPLSRFVVTARQIGYSAVKLDKEIFSTFVLSPFDRRQVENYVRKWFTAAEVAAATSAERLTADFISASTSIPDLRSNPLLLSFICVLYRGMRYIPRKRTEMYQKCVDLLLEAWDRFNDVSATDDSREVVQVAVDTYFVALTDLAAAIYSSTEFANGMSEHELRSATFSSLVGEAVPDPEAAMQLAGEIVRRCRGRAWLFTDVGLNEDGDEVYSFTHTSFLEYFAAQYLLRRAATPEDLADELTATLSSRGGEVFLQICLSLVSRTVHLGGSRLMLRLLERTPRVEAEAVPVLEVLTRASDIVMLNRDAMKALLRRCCSSFAVESSRRLARALLSPGFRHAASVPRILSEELAALRTRAPEKFRQVVYNNVWAWEVCVQEGVLNVVGWAPSQILPYMFAGQLRGLTGGGPLSSADWVAASIAGSDGVESAKAGRCLATIRRSLGDPSEAGWAYPSPAPGSDVVVGLREVCDRFDTALYKSVGRGPDCTAAMLLLCMGLVEIIDHWLPSEPLPEEGAIRRLVDARIGTRIDDLPAGTAFLPDEYQRFLAEWVMQDRSIFVSGNDYPFVVS